MKEFTNEVKWTVTFFNYKYKWKRRKSMCWSSTSWELPASQYKSHEIMIITIQCGSGKWVLTASGQQLFGLRIHVHYQRGSGFAASRTVFETPSSAAQELLRPRADVHLGYVEGDGTNNHYVSLPLLWERVWGWAEGDRHRTLVPKRAPEARGIFGRARCDKLAISWQSGGAWRRNTGCRLGECDWDNLFVCVTTCDYFNVSTCANSNVSVSER